MKAYWRSVVGVVMVGWIAASGAEAQTTRRVPQDYPTIQAALTASLAGDRIVVGPGDYVGNLDFAGRAITLESSAGPGVTTIRGSGGTAIDIGPGGALLGFTVTGGTGDFGGAVSVDGFGTRIANNVFQDNVGGAGGYGAGIGGNLASPTIEGNVFRRHTCDSQFLSAVVSFINLSSPVIRNNVFADNNCRAINVTVPAQALPRIYNNTIVRNPVGIYLTGVTDISGQVYRNNVIAENLVGVEFVSSGVDSTPAWQNNLVFANEIDYLRLADQTGLNGNIRGNPSFINSQSGDFHLRPGSAAIDSGTALGSPGSDFDGNPRPIDGNGDGVAAFDIGAFEAAALPTRSMLISPPAGTYFQTQRVDLTLAVPDAARAIAATVRLDGTDVTSLFFSCAAFGRSGADTTLRCPSVPVAILAPGAHSWTVRVDFNDGTSATQTVHWTVRAATEP